VAIVISETIGLMRRSMSDLNHSWIT